MEGGAASTTLEPLAVARAIEAAVQEVPGVAGLSPGRFATTGTFGRGQVVRGVVVEPVGGALWVEIHLVAAEPVAGSLLALADDARQAARAAVERLGAGPVGTIDIVIDDLAGGEEASA